MTAETYLSWYKTRMNRIAAPDALSLMSSCISEPWSLLKEIHRSPSDPLFEARYWTPNPYGLPQLKERIASRYGVPEKNVMICQGATSGIYLVSQTFLKSGDRVLVESPGYEPLWQSPVLCGAQIDVLPRPQGDLPDDETVKRLVTPDTRLIMLTNLHNPTGREVSRERLQRLVTAARAIAPGIRVVIDEIYLDFNPRRESPAWDLDPAVIILSSLTKVYGLSILRCGWIFAREIDLDRLRKTQVLISGIGSRYMETLSTQVFDRLEDCRRRSLEIIARNRPILEAGLASLFDGGYLAGKIPEHGCIAFLQVPGVKDTECLTDFLEETESLFSVPGRFFGAPDHIRIGIGEITPEKLETAMHRLRNGLTAFQSLDR
ncbi:MAG TPA: pyridoxal phosphate-dependent aminotransferase [bacterium]|nr:pyridoxal phosphate-dependent aminotransferase [bacterium]